MKTVILTRRRVIAVFTLILVIYLVKYVYIWNKVNLVADRSVIYHWHIKPSAGHQTPSLQTVYGTHSSTVGTAIESSYLVGNQVLDHSEVSNLRGAVRSKTNNARNFNYRGKDKKALVDVDVLIPANPDGEESPALEHRKKRSLSYCNSRQSVWAETSEEGLTPAGYRLIGVVLVVRHGDRSPMYTLPNHTGPHLSCSMLSASPSPTHAIDMLLFVRKFLDSSNQDEGRQYVADMHSVVRLNNSKSSHLFHRFGMYPSSTVCSGAQLTVQGAVQMLRLGKFLRSRYSAVRDSSVSSDAKSFVPRIFIRSTEYPRTFQSAVALVYGFSGVSALLSSRFETTRNIFFCSETITNLSCVCPAAGKMMWTFKRGRTYSSEERKIRTKIGRIFNVTSSSLPWMPAMMEVFMAYACHDLPLPCIRGSRCINWDLINDMWQLSDSEALRNSPAVPLSASPLNSTSRKSTAHQMVVMSSKLLAYPLLQEIVSRLLNLTQYRTKDNAENIIIYSGHDKTIAVILRALGIFNERWPPYAARVVLELYAAADGHDRPGRHYVRLLYNGRDFTSNLPFCPLSFSSARDQRMCPFENLVYYVMHKLLSDFSIPRYDDACVTQ